MEPLGFGRRRGVVLGLPPGASVRRFDALVLRGQFMAFERPTLPFDRREVDFRPLAIATIRRAVDTAAAAIPIETIVWVKAVFATLPIESA